LEINEGRISRTMTFDRGQSFPEAKEERDESDKNPL
jgi:hypothetical protein